MSMLMPMARHISQHETFSQRLCRDMASWGREARPSDGFLEQVKSGRSDEAVQKAQHLADPTKRWICLAAISKEQAASGDLERAHSTARLINDNLSRAHAWIDIAKERKQQGDLGGAVAELTEALSAAKRVRDKSWRAVTLADIAVVQASSNAPLEDTRETCQAAIQASLALPAEERIQPLQCVVTAMCLCGDLEDAAAVVDLTRASGGVGRAASTLGAALMFQGDIQRGLTMLDDVAPSLRFEAMRSVAYRLTASNDMNRLAAVCAGRSNSDRLGLALGQGSYLQESGRFREAIEPLQMALDIVLQRLEVPYAQQVSGTCPTAAIRTGRNCRSEFHGPSAADIRADLALNHARLGQFDEAWAIADSIAEPATQRRTHREICVCQAEACDYDAARTRCMSLVMDSDRAQVLASIAAVLETNRYRRLTSPLGDLDVRGGRPSKKTVQDLLDESIRLAGTVEDICDRHVSLLWTATAATVCGVYEAAAAIAFMFKDHPELEERVLRILDRGSEEMLRRRQAQIGRPLADRPQAESLVS